MTKPRKTADLFPGTLAQRTGEQGVGADTGTDRDRDHQKLNREGEPQCSQRFLTCFPHIGQENAVHDIIKRLEHH